MYANDNLFTGYSWFDDGWSFDEWNDDWCSVGLNDFWEEFNDNSASTPSLGSFDLGAMSSPKRIELTKMKLHIFSTL